MFRPSCRGSTPTLALGLAALVLTGCATAPPRPYTAPAAAVPSYAPPRPDLSVYAAPALGQTPEQADRDRYECSNWATEQTGFRPAIPGSAAPRPVALQPVPAPGSGVFGGAMLGAFVGSLVGNPWHNGPSTLIGMAAGALIGGAAEAGAATTAQAANSAAIAQAQAEAARTPPPGAAEYRRALSACLEGRGYIVR